MTAQDKPFIIAKKLNGHNEYLGEKGWGKIEDAKRFDGSYQAKKYAESQGLTPLNTQFRNGESEGGIVFVLPP